MILSLNQDISFEFQKKFQLRFSQKELQKLILNKFKRLDYESTNTIITYIADLFFEDSYLGNSNSSTSYIYQHRRYQEYFFTLKLKTEYEKNPLVLREFKILSNKEYFENIFLPYLRKEYKNENNLPGIIELNLIDVYLGKSNSFGIDDHYLNSSDFIPALVAQNENIFNELFENENLKIKEKVSIDLHEIKKQFEIWNGNNNDYDSSKYLIKVWENHIPFLIEIIVLLWKSNNEEIANSFRFQLKNIMDLFQESKFLEITKANLPLNDPFWTQFENRIYYRLIIIKEDIKVVYKNLIQQNYKNSSDDNGYSNKESGKQKLIKSLIRVCLNYRRVDLYRLLGKFDEYEFLALLDIFRTIEYLPAFIKSETIYETVKTFLNNFTQEINENSIAVLFFKKFFNMEIKDIERKFLKEKLTDSLQIRKMDWDLYDTQTIVAIISYIIDEFTFEKFLKKDMDKLKFYNELGLYSALYKDFISLLKEEKEVEEIVRDYIHYIKLYIKDSNSQKYLKENISLLWAYIFAWVSDIEKISRLKDILIKEENNIVTFSFLLKLHCLIPKIFPKIVNESELLEFEKQIISWNGDYQSLVNQCFQLSILCSRIDQEKAKYYFEKAVIDGILRHGWRKDTIVSFGLTDAFEIIHKNNWLDNKKIMLMPNRYLN